MANAPWEMAPKANVEVARNHGWRGIDFNKKLARGNLAGPYSSVHLTLAAHSFDGRPTTQDLHCLPKEDSAILGRNDTHQTEEC